MYLGGAASLRTLSPQLRRPKSKPQIHNPNPKLGKKQKKKKKKNENEARGRFGFGPLGSLVLGALDRPLGAASCQNPAPGRTPGARGRGGVVFLAPGDALCAPAHLISTHAHGGGACVVRVGISGADPGLHLEFLACACAVFSN
jgi:hypothetical protein